MVHNEYENKRTQPRRNLYFYLQVVDSKTEETIGRVVDLTTNGMLLINQAPFEIGSTHDAKIILSGDLFDLIMSDIEVSFTTQWAKPDVNPSNFVNGLKFKNLTPKAIRTIERVIRKFGFEEDDDDD